MSYRITIDIDARDIQHAQAAIDACEDALEIGGHRIHKTEVVEIAKRHWSDRGTMPSDMREVLLGEVDW